MSSASSQKPPVPTLTKGAAASPKIVSQDVELGSVQNGEAIPNLPLEEDIMQCARLGALEHIQKLIQSGKVNPKYQDEAGITPLHWAAINNQFAVCKYLIEQGADVNIRGGDANATPAMWAAQRCADPLLMDGQGYNILHLATIDGNALLVLLLLHQNIPVDVTDPQGHTSLMWAGYKGWPACVDLLLRWGANVNAKDTNGYTPLHWALVKGSKPCLEKILEYGADRFAKNNEGKTPAICAEEMNSKRPYHRALIDQGYKPDGTPQNLPFNLSTILRDRSKMSKFFFLYPFAILFIALYIVSHYSIFIGLPLSLVLSFGLQWIAQQLALKGPPEFHVIHRTPYLAGVFAATLFWVGILYLTALLPATWAIYPISNIIFTLLFSATTYFYFISMMEDPGWIPKLASRNQQREVIQQLFELWKFDEDNFCVQCMIRKPLRSKHCRRCGRCVAKQDHHCPWINNCVANNNIRHFYIYIITLELGIIVYTRLVLAYFDTLPTPSQKTCNILSESLCSIVLRDPWTIALTIWALLQLVWVTMLIVVQSFQISKNQTTYENMRSHSHHEHGPRPHHPITHGASSAAQSLNDTAAASTRLHPPPRRPDSCLTRWKKLLGLDAFMATASDASQGRTQRRSNPFSRGIMGNCKDFWCDPAPIFGKRNNGEGYLGGQVVDYTRLYEAPIGLRRSGRDGMIYTSVAADESDEV